MLAQIKIEGERFAESLRILECEGQVMGKFSANEAGRLIGILAEMGAAEYLTSRYRGRMVVPVGLMARTSMIGHRAFEEGDIITIDRSKGDKRRTLIYEVKGHHPDAAKVIIRQDHAEKYYDQGVYTVFFCEVDVNHDKSVAIVKVLDMCSPRDILDHWIACKNNAGFECFQSPEYRNTPAC